jgi:hypothetical protein
LSACFLTGDAPGQQAPICPVLTFNYQRVKQNSLWNLQKKEAATKKEIAALDNQTTTVL